MYSTTGRAGRGVEVAVLLQQGIFEYAIIVFPPNADKKIEWKNNNNKTQNKSKVKPKIKVAINWHFTKTSNAAYCASETADASKLCV